MSSISSRAVPERAISPPTTSDSKSQRTAASSSSSTVSNEAVAERSNNIILSNNNTNNNCSTTSLSNALSSPLPSPMSTRKKHAVVGKAKRLSRSSTEVPSLFSPLSSSSSSLTQLQQQQQDQQQKKYNDKSVANNQEVMDEVQKLLLLNNLVNMPYPKSPASCPLFCCFYAKFDNKVGPKVCYQSPRQFMHQDINISANEIHDILATTFKSYNVYSDDKEKSKSSNDNNKNGNDKNPSNPEELEQQQQSTLDGSETKIKINNNDDDDDNNNDNNDNINDSDLFDCGTGGYDDDENFEDEEVALPPGAQSIFDATSEYIITGNELTGKIINLSTHNMHILTRPTSISDERYERNSLLFCLGFVLRRAADPRPFRPLLAKWALTLRSMEIETRFLSKPDLGKHLQPMLARIFMSLNSPQWECNMLLTPSSALNLRLFHPPRVPPSPVPDHAVPILLRRDLQQSYDWDLAINWVTHHIDGITNARQISQRAEVDIEIVRACLRVLKHHGVIALVDMFLYSNRYEFTEKAARMLAGKEPMLLEEALDFVIKVPVIPATSVSGSTALPYLQNPGGSGSEGSPRNSPSSPYPSAMNLIGAGGSSQRSYNYRFAMAAAQSLEKDSTMSSRREDQKTFKSSIAELYCACNRHVSFGDLWITLTTQSTSSEPSSSCTKRPGSMTKGNKNRRSSYSRGSSSAMKGDPIDEGEEEEEIIAEIIDPFKEQLDSLALSPVETSYLETLRKRSKQNKVDWDEIFQKFDHRRFTSFGLVHGILIRVHNFPYAPVSIASLSINNSGRTDSKHSSINNNYYWKRDHILEEENINLAQKVAAMMDGTHCDDELCSMFERPFSDLVHLVEKYSGKKIVSIYAPSGESTSNGME